MLNFGFLSLAKYAICNVLPNVFVYSLPVIVFLLNSMCMSFLDDLACHELLLRLCTSKTLG